MKANGINYFMKIFDCLPKNVFTQTRRKILRKDANAQEGFAHVRSRISDQLGSVDNGEMTQRFFSSVFLRFSGKKYFPARRVPWARIALLALLFCAAAPAVYAGTDPEIVTRFKGSDHEIVVTSPYAWRETIDPVYYDPQHINEIDNPANDKYLNTIALFVDEDDRKFIPADFMVTVTVEITWTDKDGNLRGPIQKQLQVDYKIAEGTKYDARNYYWFDNARKVKVTIIAVDKHGASWDVTEVLTLENRMQVKRDYIFNTTGTATNLQAVPGEMTPENKFDELVLSWTHQSFKGITHYDVEWAWVDIDALDRYKSGNPLNFDAALLFRNNSTRVTISSENNSYKIPLIYDGAGYLFYRVRPLQYREDGDIKEGEWSASGYNGITYYNFTTGHEPSLNWQVSTTYAEEGKRKTVISYFDGTLRSRQTVTKDNVNNNTVVAETLYDYQGRPAISILPAPTLNKVIEYAENFNRFSSSSYPKDIYDLVPVGQTICSVNTPPLDNNYGSAKYYSPNNPKVNDGFNKYIPDAEGFPYAETRYVPDATGRIATQGGVGTDYQLGAGKHATNYYYGYADQKELNALFGTEVGEQSHYFKNMVRDANGQYSVSYVDMHGRTIATALAGDPPANMQPMNSYSSQTMTKNLLGKGNNIVKGRSIESATTLLVTKAGLHTFHYELNPQSAEIAACNPLGQTVCYDCYYDLEIRVTGTCGQTPIIITRKNFSFGNYDVSCANAPPSLVVDTSWVISEGEYNITKTLRLSKDAQNWYKENLFTQKNICKTLQTFYTGIYDAMVAANSCAMTCTSCATALGTFAQYRIKFLQSIGADPNSIVPYEKEIADSYAEAKANCDALCSDPEYKISSIRLQLLNDMTADVGQYAKGDVDLDGNGVAGEAGVVKYPPDDPDHEYPQWELNTNRKYNIFNTAPPYPGYRPGNVYTPFYHYPNDEKDNSTWYKNEQGLRDESINTTAGGNALTPLRSYSPDQFIPVFKDAWAASLIYYHPEYCKLKTIENNPALVNSFNWDTKVEKTETWAAALTAETSGYIYYNKLLDKDPFFNMAGNSSMKNIMSGFVNSNFREGKSIWQIALAVVKCDNMNDPACINAIPAYPTSTNAFDVNLCTSDKNNVWKIFRSIYLSVKDSLFNLYLDQQCPGINYTELKTLGYQRRFGHIGNYYSMQVADIISNSTDPDAEAENQLLPTYTSTCESYINMWEQQLLKCDVLAARSDKQQVLDAITSQMRQVCIWGSNVDHPNGSSTLAAGDPRNPNSFETIISNVFSSYGISISSLCHPFLVDFPQPYDKQIPMGDDVIINPKDECICSRLNELQYEKTQTGYPGNLSQFIQYQHGIYIRQTFIVDTLMAGCQSACKTYDPPLSVPAILSCTTPLKNCITCDEYNTLRTTFKNQYPSFLVPYREPQTDEEVNRNKMFELFMNSRTGFRKSIVEYIQFEMACENFNQSWTCARLDSIITAFHDAYPNIGYGESCKQAFTNYFNQAFGTFYTYEGIEALYKQYCAGALIVCEPTLNCAGFNQVVSDFYALYGATVYNNPNCQVLFVNYFNGRFQTSYTWAGLQSLYLSLCYEGQLDVCNPYNAPRLQQAMSDWRTQHPLAWADSTCLTQWTNFFNVWFQANLAEWQIAALYSSAGITYTPCQPPVACSILQQMITMYNNMGSAACDSSGLNPSSPTYCTDCFAWFINHKLNTNYTYEQISLMYSKCGAPLTVCSGTYSCTQLSGRVEEFIRDYTGPAGDCQAAFTAYFNQQFNKSLSYTEIMAVYKLYCGQEPAICGRIPITSCQQLTDVKNNFLAIYSNPSGYFGINCQAAFASYFNQAFGDTLSYPSISLYYQNLCGQALSICDTTQCQTLRVFLTNYHQQYDTLSLPQALCRDLFSKLLNDQLQAGSGGGKEDPPPVIYKWHEFAAMYQHCGINLDVCGGNGPLVTCNNIRGARQAFYILNPTATQYGNCDDLFRQFFNLYFNTTFATYAALEQWVTQQCNFVLNVCGGGSGGGGTVILNLPPPSGNPPTAPRLCESTTMFPTVEEPNDPCEFIKTLALNAASEQYNIYIRTQKDDFDKRYNEKCLAAGSLEQFTVTSAVSEYHYTLYYYDQAGQLVKTVPPAGVNPDFSTTFYNAVETARQNVMNGQPLASNIVVPNHTLLTEYRYNTLGQVIQQKSPDGGLSKFWYDRLGRLVVSQNQKQGTSNKYSYTKYDVFGRITEVGQLTGTAVTQSLTQDDTQLGNWFTAANSSREQITVTKYDEPQANFCDIPPVLCQKNLRNRVSYTYVQPTASYISNSQPYSTATFYTYDLHGNVDVLLQHYNEGLMWNTFNGFKRIEYKYDLISGKVNEVAYQPGVKDQYYHRYSYDAENKLTKVETSTDYVYWQQQAAYTYYRHGPLARTETGQLAVQGTDYVYTLQGWLKGVNSTSTGGGFDAGGDYATGIRAARDAYGFSLNYNTNDYRSINNTVTPFVAGTFNLVNTDAATVAKPLYNGNIAAMMVNIPKIGDAQLYGYKYDQLNRISSMDAFGGLNNTNNTFTATTTSNYKERVTYDGNGNILTYLRNGTTANSNQLAMDNLTYNYIAGSNKLSSVSDAVAAGNYTTDIDNQSANNYDYDEIGNLVKDNQEGITNIEWTVYGKIKTITKSGGPNVSYTYDASGNRISKLVNTPSGVRGTFYVRDASGNVMAIYENGNSAVNSGKLSQIEVDLYGSSRLGIWQRNLDVETANWWLFERTAMAGTTNGGMMDVLKRGKTTYELSNHLGNVLVNVSDRKLQVQDGSTGTTAYYSPDVVSANDYYPFGLDMPGRVVTPGGSEGSRYGFNGKERDKDMHSLTAYDYGFRIYNPAIGRFLSVDPLSKSYPWYTPYQFAGNKPTIAIDLDGLEEVEVTIGVQQWTDPKLQSKAIEVAKKDPQALAALQQTAYNVVLTELDAIVAKHFDPKKNSAPDWSGITKDVGEYFWNSTASSSLGIWNSYYNYNDPGATVDELSAKIDQDVKWIVNNHFYAASAGTEHYYKYIKLINEAKDPNKKAALIAERELVAKQKWQEVFKGAQLGFAELFMAIMGSGDKLPSGTRGFNSGATAIEKFVVRESKWDYFFGRVGGQNAVRTAQNLKDLKLMGITNRTQLEAQFAKALENGETVGTRVDQYGTTVSKLVKVGEAGSITVRFLYRGSNMNSVPEVTSILPKIFK